MCTRLILILMTHFVIASSFPLPSIETLNTIDGLDYAPQPNEILSIQPILLYPAEENLQLEGREVDDDNNENGDDNGDDSEIIFVKLLRRRGYRPIRQNSNGLNDDDSEVPREITMKDIFYVKALANGQFSDQRIKLYRLPEFYAISVYHHKGGAKH